MSAAQNTPAQTQSRPAKRSSGSRTSSACQACKKRKTRCSGEPAPCKVCQTFGTDCVIDQSLDMRRKAAMERTMNESKLYKESLSQLVQLLRDGKPEVFQTIVNALQEEVPLAETATMIQTLLRKHSSSASTDYRPQQTTQRQLTCADEDDVLHVTDYKEEKGDAYFQALLKFLQSNTPASAEDVLRRLIPTSELAAYFQGPEARLYALDSYFQHPPARPRNIDVGTTADYDEGRQYWHPALRLKPFEIRAQLQAESAATPFELDLEVSQKHFAMSDQARSYRPARTSKPFTQYTDDEMDYSDVHQVQNMHSGAIRTLLHGFEDFGTAYGEPEGQHDSTYFAHAMIKLDEAPMSRVYTDYIRAIRRTTLTTGLTSQLLEPGENFIVDLMFRQRTPDDAWNCCSWACELMRSFTEFELYVRLANVYFLTRWMKWLLFPTSDNFGKLPDMMKPTASQRKTPHIGAIDLIPMPCIRDAVIARLRDWLTPLSEANWTVNWPHGEREALERDPATNSIRLSARFMRHVEDYNAWSVGSSFLIVFPEVADKIRIHDDGQGHVSVKAS